MASTIVTDKTLSHVAKELSDDWKFVGRTLGLSDPCLYGIEDDNATVSEAKYKMLLAWKHKLGSEATNEMLAGALKTNNRRDLAEYVTSLPVDTDGDRGEASNTIPEVLETNKKSSIFIECLKKRYRDMCRRTLPIPWKRSRKVNINETFVEIGIKLLDQTKDDAEESSWEKIDSYKGLLQHSELEQANCIIIEGGPGCGKTTLFYHLANLWCKGLPPMDKVRIFILLLVKNIKRETSIYESIRKNLVPKDIQFTEKDIENILTAKDDLQNILALDGLNEYPGGIEDANFRESDIMSSLRGEMITNVKKVVSTRLSCLPNLEECDVERVRLQKFGETQWKTYVHKVYQDDSVCEPVIKSIKENSLLRGLCEIPLFMSLIVHILRDDIVNDRKLKFETVTAIFKHLIIGMMAHHKEKKLSLQKYDSSVASIEKTAFQSPLPPSKVMTWEKEELLSYPNYDMLVSSGILVEEESPINFDGSISDIDFNSKSVTFVHHLFQEWFGARHFATYAGKAVFREMLRDIDPDDLQYLLRFTCGRNMDATKPILEYLLEVGSLDIFALCFIEHGSKKSDKDMLNDVVSRICDRRIAFNGYTSSTVVNTAYSSLLRYITKEEMTLRHLYLSEIANCKGDTLILKNGVFLSSLPTVQSITFDEWPKVNISSWLKECLSLQTVVLTVKGYVKPDFFWEVFGRRGVSVFYLAKGSDAGAKRDCWCKLKGKVWLKIHDYKCDGCGEDEILGSRFRCRVCHNYNLCESCKHSGIHKEHIFREFYGFELKHEGYNCSDCGEKDVKGILFTSSKPHCKFTLCESCKEKGKQEGHRFRRHDQSSAAMNFAQVVMTLAVMAVTVKGFKSSFRSSSEKSGRERAREDGRKLANPIENSKRSFIKCNACGESSTKVRFRCKACPYFNLCEHCKENGRHIQGHEFCQFHGKEIEHFSVICDECGENPLVGIRYRCRVCDDYDLCQCCKDRVKHPRHKFQVIRGEEVVHYHIGCNNCGEENVRGTRYRCEVCLYYNICDWCKENGVHDHHRLRKVDPALMVAHTFISCFGCDEQDIRGIRYRCKTCKYLNFCQLCYERREDKDHEYQEYLGTEFPHKRISCNGCGESNVRGNRYRCRLRDYFNLCEICKNRDDHEDCELMIFDGSEVKHEYNKCKGCEEQPIIGPRYRCTKCKLYDLCECCKERGVHHQHHLNKFNGHEHRSDANCTRCGTKEIIGNYYRCKLCTDVTLCERCMDKDVHWKHGLKKFDGTEYVHSYINCDGCKEERIKGVRYRCTRCNYFNLCEGCMKRGQHSQHSFRSFNGTEHVHKNISCDNCGEINIRGNRFRFKKRRYFNFCEICKDNGNQQDYEIQKFDGSEFEHYFIPCNECGERHIRGIRYRCKSCSYYNLCHLCKNKGVHIDHEFEVFDGSEHVHLNISCDNCKEKHIRGDRYRSNSRDYVNLCRQCKEKEDATNEVFQLFDGSEEKHVRISCNSCEEKNITGIRHRCRECKYFNLCDICKDREKHPDHEMQSFDGSEVKHSYYRCGKCAEKPIVGSRYRSNTIRNLNLCEICKKKEDLGPLNDFKEITKPLKSWIVCSSCGRGSLLNCTMYRCKSCEYFNRCQICADREEHEDHEFEILSGSTLAHLNIDCDGCGEEHIRGLRYRCTECLYFNLCCCCRRRNVHKHKEYQIFDGTELRHEQIKCIHCQEMPIIGARFKCKVCEPEEVSICETCHSKRVHPMHAMEEYKNDIHT